MFFVFCLLFYLLLFILHINCTGPSLRLSMLDFSVILLQAKLPIVDRIHPQSNKFFLHVWTTMLQVTQNFITALLVLYTFHMNEV